jgi:hypothetical protein
VRGKNNFESQGIYKANEQMNSQTANPCKAKRCSSPRRFQRLVAIGQFDCENQSIADIATFFKFV